MISRIIKATPVLPEDEEVAEGEDYDLIEDDLTEGQESEHLLAVSGDHPDNDRSMYHRHASRERDVNYSYPIPGLVIKDAETNKPLCKVYSEKKVSVMIREAELKAYREGYEAGAKSKLVAKPTAHRPSQREKLLDTLGKQIVAAKAEYTKDSSTRNFDAEQRLIAKYVCCHLIISAEWADTTRGMEFCNRLYMAAKGMDVEITRLWQMSEWQGRYQKATRRFHRKRRIDGE